MSPLNYFSKKNNYKLFHQYKIDKVGVYRWDIPISYK